MRVWGQTLPTAAASYSCCECGGRKRLKHCFYRCPNYQHVVWCRLEFGRQTSVIWKSRFFFGTPPSGGWRNELHSTVASWHARPAGFNGCAPVSGSFLWQGWWWWCLGWFHFYLFVCRLYFLLMNTVRWDATKPESSCKVGRCSSVQVFSSFQIFGERGLCIHFVRERWM